MDREIAEHFEKLGASPEQQEELVRFVKSRRGRNVGQFVRDLTRFGAERGLNFQGRLTDFSKYREWLLSITG